MQQLAIFISWLPYWWYLQFKIQNCRTCLLEYTRGITDVHLIRFWTLYVLKRQATSSWEKLISDIKNMPSYIHNLYIKMHVHVFCNPCHINKLKKFNLNSSCINCLKNARMFTKQGHKNALKMHKKWNIKITLNNNRYMGR